MVKTIQQIVVNRKMVKTVQKIVILLFSILQSI